MAGADRVQADAALKACAGAPAEFALHLVLGDQIVRPGRDVQEAVGDESGDLAFGRPQFWTFEGQPIGLRRGVDGGEDDRMLDRLLHPLPHEKHVHAPAAQ